MPLLSLRNADGCRTAILDADVENVADEDDVKTHFAGEQIDVLGTRSIPSFGSVIGTRNGLFQQKHHSGKKETNNFRKQPQTPKGN